MLLSERLARYEPLETKRGFIRIEDRWAELDLKWIQNNIADLEDTYLDDLAIIPKGKKYPKAIRDSFSDFGDVITQLKTAPAITFTDEFINKIHSHYLAWEKKMLFVEERLQVCIESFHKFTETHRKVPYTGVPVELTQDELAQVIEDLKPQINFVRQKRHYTKISEALADEEVKSIEEGMKYVKENVLSWYVSFHRDTEYDCTNAVLSKSDLETEITTMKKAVEYYESLLVRFQDIGV